MNINAKSIRTALFAIEHGPMASAAYNHLKVHTDLRHVIISDKINTESRFDRLKEYGLWYAYQYIITKTLNYFRRSIIKKIAILADGINYDTWTNNTDSNRIAKLLKTDKVEVIFICGFHHKLDKEFIGQFKHIINIHPSCLPYYRGPEPITWALLDHQTHFGITLHYVDINIDTGNIISQHKISKPSLPLAALVEIRLAKAIPCLLRDVCKHISAESVTSTPQLGGFYLPAPTLYNRKLRNI